MNKNTTPTSFNKHSKQSAKSINTETLFEYNFIDTVNLWRNKIRVLAKEHDLGRLERRLLVYIGRNPGIRQADLAFIMDVEPQSLTRSLDKMEQKKWIKKQEDDKDKRAKSLHLTTLGEKKLDDAIKINEKIRPKALKDIPENEIQLLNKVMKDIRKNLEKI